MKKAIRRKNFRRISSHLRRDVFGYKYMKRNVLAATGTVATVLMLAVVIKYGEAIDDNKIKANTTYQTTFVEDDSMAGVMDSIHTTEQIQVAQAKATAPKEEEIESTEFDDKIIVKTSDFLNVRTDASTDAEVVGKMENGAVGEVVSVDGDWIEIASGDVDGFVLSDYVLTGEEAAVYSESFKQLKGTVTEETVRVRSDMTTDSDIVDLVAKDQELEVVNEGDEWTKVVLKSGEEGYISSEYVSVEYTFDEAMTLAEYDSIYNPPEEVQVASNDSDSEAKQPEKETTTTEAKKEDKTEEKTEAKTEAPKKEDTSSEDTASGSYADSYLLACLVSMEAGNTSYEQQLAVANVVLNRLKSGKWGNTISDVIYAKGQFPCATGSAMKKFLKNGPVASSQKAANDALAGNNNIGSFTGFTYKSAVDTSKLSDYIIMGNTIFF